MELDTSPFLRVRQFFARGFGGSEKRGDEVFRNVRALRNNFKVVRPWGQKEMEAALEVPGSPSKKPKF
ncbi:unnamed protein product [Amoebophrya sp. A25]|nr:unnamed protein product [Amoebophrya sp. A25]|eukprot:GSA25T00021093001.1